MPLLASTAKLTRPLQIPGVILSFIIVILDPATEQRIQREIARGLYTEPAELINRALDLLESQENWLLRNKEAINERLTDSMA